jgi:DNA-binding response OmpR family regulator
MKTLKKKKTALAERLARPRIAIVEDDADFRDLVRGWLAPRYDTMSFESADECLDSDDDAFDPDLLITDVKMPGLSGFKLCETVRAHPRYSRLPVLFLTGVDSDEGFLLGQEAGASAYLTKPVERALLLAKIEELLGG